MNGITQPRTSIGLPGAGRYESAHRNEGALRAPLSEIDHAEFEMNSQGIGVSFDYPTEDRMAPDVDDFDHEGSLQGIGHSYSERLTALIRTPREHLD
jgi:hypothetical protein